MVKSLNNPNASKVNRNHDPPTCRPVPQLSHRVHGGRAVYGVGLQSLDWWNGGIAVSNPAEGMDVWILFCVVKVPASAKG